MGFSFEYLPKLKAIKSANNKGVTLVHFLARQVIALTEPLLALCIAPLASFLLHQ
jgi:hypothetical protein